MIKAGDSFDQIAADELNYTGCIQWAFDDLPETYAFIQKGQDFIGFPALVDEGDAVGVKIFDTQQKAALQHSSGLMRLFALQLRKECSYVSKNLAPRPPVCQVFMINTRCFHHKMLGIIFRLVFHIILTRLKYNPLSSR